MSLHPEPSQLQVLVDRHLDAPVLMLNLLRFAPDGGREAYARYATEAGPHLAAAGAQVRLHAPAALTLIGPPEEAWDEMIVVAYPSGRAFLEMVGNPDYQAAAAHRSAALVDSRLVVCAPEG